MSIEVGSILEGTVSGITKFGAFIELPENKTGLVHISEVADVYVNDVNDFLKQGQKIKVKVLAINDNGRIGLSVKQVPENKAAQAAAAPRGERPQAGGQGVSFADRIVRLVRPVLYLLVLPVLRWAAVSPVPAVVSVAAPCPLRTSCRSS